MTFSPTSPSTSLSFSSFPLSSCTSCCLSPSSSWMSWTTTTRTAAEEPSPQDYNNSSTDSMTADHKDLSEDCELETITDTLSWYKIWQLYGLNHISVKQKLYKKQKKSLQKFLESTRKPKVIYTDNSLEFGKTCEDLSCNHRTSTLHRSETNGIAERAVRRRKEVTFAVLLQWGLDEKLWADSLECYCELRNIQDLLSDGKTPYERLFGKPF